MRMSWLSSSFEDEMHIVIPASVQSGNSGVFSVNAKSPAHRAAHPANAMAEFRGKRRLMCW